MVSLRLVGLLIARGEIPAFKIGDRRTFVRREAIERYLAKREAAATAPDLTSAGPEPSPLARP